MSKKLKLEDFRKVVSEALKNIKEEGLEQDNVEESFEEFLRRNVVHEKPSVPPPPPTPIECETIGEYFGLKKEN